MNLPDGSALFAVVCTFFAGAMLIWGILIKTGCLAFDFIVGLIVAAAVWMEGKYYRSTNYDRNG